MKADRALWQRGEQTLALFEQLLRRSPSAGSQMLCALDFYLAKPSEVALIGDREECRAFADVLHRCFAPNKILVAAEPGANQAERALPLLEGKLQMGSRAFVCRDQTCSRPLPTPIDLQDELEGGLYDHG